MDLYKAESEFIDSLDFLSPPVKRNRSSRNEFGGVYNGELNRIHLFQEQRSQVIETTERVLNTKRNAKTGIESSTSLILKKTYERQVQGHNSVLSYTNLEVSSQNVPSTQLINHHGFRNKPLIRVTVIPKSDQIQTAKYLKKRRHTIKRVQSSLSNQENSVQTKNLYLVVTGRKKDKIYEIKTTGSATLSSDQTDYSKGKNDDFSIDELTNVRQLIQSLDMGQNKKKDKKESKPSVPPHSWLVSNGTNPYETDELESPNAMGSHAKMSNKSRVRIYGQVGITDDDRYVLKYGATVNDKPVSDFAQFTSGTASPEFMPMVGFSSPMHRVTDYDAAEDTKEASVQASYSQPKPSLKMLESQGTQVNFNLQVTSTNQGTLNTSEKDIQCNCYYTGEMKQPENKSTEIVIPKDCHSPLVIISVYPKQSPEEVAKTDSITPETRRNQSPQRAHVAQVQYTPRLKMDKSSENKAKPEKTYEKRSKTEKPLENKFKTEKTVENTLKTEKNIDNRFKTEKIFERKLDPKPIPSREKKTADKNADGKRDVRRSVASRTPSPVKNVSKGKMQDKSFGEKAPITVAEKKSPDRYKAMAIIKNKILEKDKHHTESPGTSKLTSPNLRQGSKNRATSRKPSPTRLPEKATNTYELTKKVLVDSYTKKLMEQMNQRDMIPAKLDNSKVTVNIDGEHEYYNLLFDQGKLTTDLRIRKTMKDIGSQNVPTNEYSAASLENLLAFPEKDDETQPVSLPSYNKQYVKTPHERVSGITIRDSLEISHRREDKNSSNVKNTQTLYSAHHVESVTNDTEYAPIKHYTGDDCSILDPVERDKQIRVLLGVDRTKLQEAYSSEKDDFPYQCFYRRECEKSQVAEINLVKLCPCLKYGIKKRSIDCHSTPRCSDTDCNTSDCNVAIYRNANMPLKYQTDNPTTFVNCNAPVFNNDHTPVRNFNNIHTLSKNVGAHLVGGYATSARNVNMATSTDIMVNRICPRAGAGAGAGFNADAVTDSNCYCKLIGSSSELFDKNQKENSVQCCHCDTSTANLKKDKTDDGARVRDKKYKAENSIYQQLVLNRNIQVFLQVEQFSKQKPIILSRQQYNKVKKTIQNTICNKASKERRRKIAEKAMGSEVSVGEIRKKRATDTIMHYDQQVQTNSVPSLFSSQEEYKRPTSARRGGGGFFAQTASFSTNTVEIQSISNYERRRGTNSYTGEELSERGDFDLRKESMISITDKVLPECYMHGDVRRSRSRKGDRLDEMHYRSNEECYRRSGRHIMDTSTGPHHRNNYPYQCSSCSDYLEQSNRSDRYKKNRENVRDSWDSYLINKDHPRINKKHHSSQGSHQRSRNVNSLTQTDYYLPSNEPDEIKEVLDEQQKEDKSCQKLDERYQKNYGEEIFKNRYSSDNKNRYPSEYKTMHVRNVDAFTETDFILDQYDGAYNKYEEINVAHEINPRYVGEKEYNQDLCRETETEPMMATKYLQKVFGEEEELQTDIEIEQVQSEIPQIPTFSSTACMKPLKVNEDYALNINLSQEFDTQKDDHEETQTVMLFNAKDRSNAETDRTDSTTRKTMSSMQIHYASVAYMNQMDLTSSDVTIMSDSSVGHVNSFQTIFRGHRKTPTPNLGTSVYSLYSDEEFNSDKSAKYIMAPRDVKVNKKPFLMRLMSCLVMRSTRTSALKLPIAPVQDPLSINSSIDSYHISTSLAAVEVSSSIYDTSASFYSNHTILPINSKIKRGFFNSVRGFLTNRRS